MERCARCGSKENVKWNLCGSCADELRDEEQALDEEDYQHLRSMEQRD